MHKFDYETHVFETNKIYYGQCMIDEQHDFDNIFIYCVILEPRIVGDTNTSLLVTLENPTNLYSFSETVTTRLSKIRYYPIAKRQFHTIRIDFSTDIGNLVKFQGGKKPL